MRPLIGKKETKNHYHMSFFELNENINKREGDYGFSFGEKIVHKWTRKDFKVFEKKWKWGEWKTLFNEKNDYIKEFK